MSILLVQGNIHYHYDSIHTLNFALNYLEINANHGDYRILHQVIAKILQCYDKRQGFLLDWSTDMLPVLFHDSHVKRVGWKRCFSFNLETKSSRYILERTRSLTKSLGSDWCQSSETVQVEEIVLISEISKDQDQSHHRLWMQMRNSDHHNLWTLQNWYRDFSWIWNW